MVKEPIQTRWLNRSKQIWVGKNRGDVTSLLELGDTCHMSVTDLGGICYYMLSVPDSCDSPLLEGAELTATSELKGKEAKYARLNGK